MKFETLDYLLMCSILLMLIVRKYRREIKRKCAECFDMGITLTILVGTIIANELGAFEGASNRCAVSRVDFNGQFDDFKKKFHETFRDNTGFAEDIPNLREEFGIMLTAMLMANHEDKTKINLLGFTEAQTNAKLLRNYVHELTEVQGDRSDRDMGRARLITDEQLKNFLSMYRNGINKVHVEDQKEISAMNPIEQRVAFKKIIFEDPDFGFIAMLTTFDSFITRYAAIREAIEHAKMMDDDDLKDAKEDEKDEFADEVKNFYDGHDGAGLIFHRWDDGDNSYENKNILKYNIRQPFYHQILDPIEDTTLQEIKEFVEKCDYSDYFPVEQQSKYIREDEVTPHDYYGLYTNLDTIVQRN